MTPDDRQQTVDISQSTVHEYFDRYLTTVFPEQIDRMFEMHNSDMRAHPAHFKALIRTKQKVDRIMWVWIGGSAVAGCLVGLIIKHVPGLLDILFN